MIMHYSNNGPINNNSRNHDERFISGQENGDHSVKQQAPHILRRRSRIAIAICYFCMIVMEIALVLGAALTSISITIGDRKSIVDFAGSYSAIQLQQKDISLKSKTLSELYRFDASLISKEINATALSQYSQKTIEYWFDLLHGQAGQEKPTWDIAKLTNAIRVDTVFQSSWLASEQPRKADEAGQAIVQTIKESVFPIEPLPLTLGFLYINNQQVIRIFALAAWVMMICAVISAVIIRIAQNSRPFQSFWFYGSSSMFAFLALSILIMLLQHQQLETVFESYNAVLAFYVSSMLTLFETYLRTFSLCFFVVGAVFLISFFVLRYQRLHSMHHELSTFF